MAGPDTIAISGTIVDASGIGVEYVVVRLVPTPAGTEGKEQAHGGLGVIVTPVEALTDGDGEFAITAIVGFRYRLIIEAIGYDRTFTCPEDDIEFHLLGLSPSVQSAAGSTDAAGVARPAEPLVQPRRVHVDPGHHPGLGPGPGRAAGLDGQLHGGCTQRHRLVQPAPGPAGDAGGEHPHTGQHPQQGSEKASPGHRPR